MGNFQSVQSIIPHPMHLSRILCWQKQVEKGEAGLRADRVQRGRDIALGHTCILKTSPERLQLLMVSQSSQRMPVSSYEEGSHMRAYESHSIVKPHK